MNQVDQNINKDMIESDLIDLDSVDLADDQTWLYKVDNDSGLPLDLVDWALSCDWPFSEDNDYLKEETQLHSLLDDLIKNELQHYQDRHKFDSRTFVKPKKRVQRPCIHSIHTIQDTSPAHSLLQPADQSANKYLTYNKYNPPPIGPMLRLKTFNLDTNTENSAVVKDYALKRRSLVETEDADATMTAEASERLAHAPTKPINIDLSQPAHNLHNTFNKGMVNIINERGSLNMYQSGESLMRMSPPSLVSSLHMDNSGNFNHESLDSRKSLTLHRDSGVTTAARDSIDPMMTSMTLSILDDKDMSTSFLSQTTYPDNDSLIGSLPPSLVGSVNTSFVISNSGKRNDSQTENNIFSSATFTHLEQSERLLSARPRAHMFNSFTKRDSALRNSESYTKAKEEACQMDATKILSEISDDSPKPNTEMSETITLHYANNKFKNDTDKENVNTSFQKEDAFYRDMGLQKPVETGKNSINLDKQELNEIIQARQKLSLARKALPTESLPNQIETSPIKTIQLPNQTITVPKQSMDNASELLARRRAINANSSFERQESNRETPKRSSTFRMGPAKGNDVNVVYVKQDDNNIIDINSATLNLIDVNEPTLQPEEWGSQERAMVGSSESTDTGTFSSSSPPDSVPDTVPGEPCLQIASTPMTAARKCSRNDLLSIHNTISPIYDIVDEKSYTVTAANHGSMERTFEVHNATAINSATMVRRPTAKRDILSGKASPERRMVAPSVAYRPQRVPSVGSVPSGLMPPPSALKKTGLPTSKLRQYSSHKELSRLPGSSSIPPRVSQGAMTRRNVYASNPVLSPQDEQEPDIRPPPKPVAPAATPVLVRQGTETLRRERPQSQLVAPKDLRAPSGMPVPAAVNHVRNHLPEPKSRPYSIAGASQLRVSRPASGPGHRGMQPPPVVTDVRPASSSEQRTSALPRPSRLPAPRRGLRPPSVYSVAPASDIDQY